METRPASGVILYKDGKMLLQHRSVDAPRNPNVWGLFGGGIEAGETPADAAKREMLEELEYRLSDPRLIDVEDTELGDLRIKMHLFVEEYDGQPLVLHEGQAYGWFTLDEALALPNISSNRRAAFVRLHERILQEMV
jgi:8-oxo-dGTP diphosphatase